MQTFPEMQTVLLVCCVANLVTSLGLFLVRATNRTYPGFRQWALASFSVFAVMALLGLREFGPERPLVILINLAFFAYPLLLARGFRKFAGRPPQNWIPPLVLTVVAVIAAYFTYYRPDPNLRVFVLSLLLVPLFADCAWLVRGVKYVAHPAIKHGLIGAFVLLAAWNLLRVPLGSSIADWSGGRLSPVLVQAATMLLLTAANIWIGLGVVLLNFAQASESLRESEERFRLAMHHSPIGMSLVDLEGRWLEVNPALCQIVGRTREELLGVRFRSITHPDDWPADVEHVRSLVERRVASYRREKRYIHKTGRTVWVQVDVSIIFNPDGTPRHLVAQIVDVTERKHTEQALLEHQTKLSMAMDTARLGHWEFDVATAQFTFDDNFLKLLGTSLAREGGRTMSAETYARRFVVPEEAGVVAEELKRAAVAADPHFTRQLEHHFRRVDGSIGLMSVRYAIEKDETGKTIRTYGLNQDITEQAKAAQQGKILEDQLRQAKKMEALGALAGGIAHDFNNILTGIMGNMQLAEMDLPRHHPVQTNLHEAGRATRRARDLVARILTFSRRYPSDRTATFLGPVVQEAVQLLRASLPATIEIRADLAADCPAVVCDPSQIHQLVMNLGTNSAHAMRHEAGVLEFGLGAVFPDRALLDRHPQVKPEHRVRLTIRDTGSGMSREVLEHIFEPFFTTKGQGEGTGLGLAMVHGIMEDHQGAIVVNSAVGRGTTFELYFPAADAAAPGGARGSVPSFGLETPFGEGRRILLVDDDETVLELGRKILTRCGFVPEAFVSPVAAQERFLAAPHAFAAVISDLTMPGLTGVELANRLRAVRPEMPFILSSGYLDAESHEGAQESGVTAFIKKPFDVEELTGKLRAALKPKPQG